MCHLVLRHPRLLSCLLKQNANFEIRIACLEALSKFRVSPLPLNDVFLKMAHCARESKGQPRLLVGRQLRQRFR